jgi:hypothetical protein
VIQFEVRRMEEEAKSLIANLSKAVAMEPTFARAFLKTVFEGKLTATPVETEGGPRFQVEGTASLARMLAIELEVGMRKPTNKFASPRGFEPLGAPVRFVLVA